MKRLNFIFSSVALMVLSRMGAHTAFGKGPLKTPQSTPAKTLTKTLHVAIMLDEGGPDDKSFNEGSLAGAKKAVKDFSTKIDYQFFQPTEGSLEGYKKQLRKLASSQGTESKTFDLILSIGAVQEKALSEVAKAFPKKNFSIIDASVKGANVASFMFHEQEGAYLGGVLAAKISKTQTIGFIGGMDIPVIGRFFTGFKAGAQSVSPKAKVLLNYVGNSGNAWNDPVSAKNIAKTQLKEGADILFAAAGASGLGALDAVSEARPKKGPLTQSFPYFIGVDSNQNHLRPGTVLTSVVKDVEGVVYTLFKNTVEGTFVPGVKKLGLKENALSLAFDKHNESLVSKDVRAAVEEARKRIIEGTVKF